MAGTEVEAFTASGLTGQAVTRPVGGETRRAARRLSLEGLPNEVSFRLARVPLPGGGEEILAASLLDADAHPAGNLGELYHARCTLWGINGIEEAFKALKHRLIIEQFSGESPEAIRQDFNAKVFTANLAERWPTPLAKSYRKTLPPATDQSDLYHRQAAPPLVWVVASAGITRRCGQPPQPHRKKPGTQAIWPFRAKTQVQNQSKA